MRRAFRFLANTTPADRAIAYGHAGWALSLTALFVLLFAAVTP